MVSTVWYAGAARQVGRPSRQSAEAITRALMEVLPHTKVWVIDPTPPGRSNQSEDKAASQATVSERPMKGSRVEVGPQRARYVRVGPTSAGDISVALATVAGERLTS
jgi:hypothetical protein